MPAPPDTVPRALPPVVVPTDTLVQIVACSPAGRAAVATILFAGNDITRERILRAELDFHEGDSLDLSELRTRLEANRRRLFNLQLFHAVSTQASCRAGKLFVIFALQERFYTFPVPILSLADRNFRSWLNRTDRWQRVDYGLHLLRTNFRGRNEQVIANLQFGFNRKYELFYEAPGLGPYRRVGFGMGISYYQSHTLDYITQSDRQVPLREDESFPVQRFYSTGGLRFRHTVQFLTALDVAYHQEKITETVNQLNPTYFNGLTRREFVNISLVSTRNERNTFAYPLTGRYLQAMLAHRQFLNSTLPALTTLRLRYARYLSLGHGFYYAAGLSGQARISRQLAYADSRALGYEALVRGYDEYVIDGQHYGLFQQGLSYRPFKASQLRLGAIRNPKINTIPLVLYLNLFTDAGYVVSNLSLPQNRLPNRLLSAVGVGLHLVTYYDRVFTAEYTLNGLGETGYFFRTSFPI
ncbi:POTRA domain-containing protein [Hymenobacter saemangeumensis]